MSTPAGFPYYSMAATLSNGMQFTVQFGPAPGLPQDLEDALAVAAAQAIRDFDWAAVEGITPPITSATVALTREDATSTAVTVP